MHSPPARALQEATDRVSIYTRAINTLDFFSPDQALVVPALTPMMTMMTRQHLCRRLVANRQRDIASVGLLSSDCFLSA